MSDMTPVIIAKSDQLNADDLVGGPITVTITRVDVRDSKEQPVTVHYQGDNGKPFKPCKSMCRVMVAAWGADSKVYPGKRMTLFRDQSVKWAGMEIGGIRISHMSDIDGPLLTSVTLAKGSKKPYRVEPLQGARADNDGSQALFDQLSARVASMASVADLDAFLRSEKFIQRRDWLQSNARSLWQDLEDRIGAARERLSRTDTPNNSTADEGPADKQRGDGLDDSDETPAWQGALDAHLKRLATVEFKADVNMAISDFSISKAALPDDVRVEVDAAEFAALARFNSNEGN